MITIKNTIDLPDTYPLERLGALTELLFFDIETTGFSGDYSNLYLIGCTYYSQGSWRLIQWFADTADAEADVLAAFFEFLDGYRVLVHFNGDGFDIPYLLKRCRAYGLPYDFSGIKSIDIYKKIKPYRNLLNLENLKQKSIERFLGIYREDQYSGGQLIEVYYDYLRTHEQVLYDMLMLHNAEDLQGMPLILPILNYPDFLESDIRLTGQVLGQQKDIFGTPYPVLIVTGESDSLLPVPISQENGLARFEAEGQALRFTIELYDGELRYFYPDYKNYYYLPYEDTAIHKSVGEYVDKDARVKATAKTCYTRKQGLFLPQYEPVWEPAFRREYKDKISYTEYREELFAEPSRFQTYLRQLLTHLF